MKARDIVLIGLICVVVVAAVGYEHSNRKENAQYRQKVAAEQENIGLKLQKLSSQMEGLKVDLNSLKLSNEDNLKKMGQIIEQQARLQAKKEKTEDRSQISSIEHRALSIENPVSNVGVVSIRKIFADCKRNAKYRDQVIAEQGRIAAELDRLSREIEAQNQGLKA